MGSLPSSDSFCQASVPDACLSDGNADSAAVRCAREISTFAGAAFSTKGGELTFAINASQPSGGGVSGHWKDTANFDLSAVPQGCFEPRLCENSTAS
jgi:hypothetical protein